MPSLEDAMEKLEAKKKLVTRIQDCIGDPEELNDWEMEFLDSIKHQLVNTAKLGLSDGQIETLEGIEEIRAEGRESYWNERRGNG